MRQSRNPAIIPISSALTRPGGDGPTLRELGYTEEGVTPLRTDAEGKLMYRTATYTSNDMSTADLDGDGQYELIVKWDPSDSRDSMISYETSAPCVIDAYDIVDGQAVLMWRIDMGYNIRAGAHDTQMRSTISTATARVRSSCAPPTAPLPAPLPTVCIPRLMWWAIKMPPTLSST